MCCDKDNDAFLKVENAPISWYFGESKAKVDEWYQTIYWEWSIGGSRATKQKSKIQLTLDHFIEQ